MDYKKIAVISDVHANIDALNTFIKYIEAEKIEAVLNLGDFTSSGPYPCEVFDLIIGDKRFINIKGYDEENIFNEVKINQGISEGKWLRDKLGQERLNKLKALPNIKSVEINGSKILLCHHNGWADIEQIIAHTKKIKYSKYDYILCGGTHLQELTHSRKYYFDTNIIDPGTLGSGDDNKAYFAIINFEKGTPIINFHSIDIESSKKGQISSDESVEDDFSSKQEDRLLNTLLYIQGPKQSKDGKMYISDEVMQRMIEIGIRSCKYVSIGCWSNEKIIIKEILYHLKCRGIKISEKDGQEWYIGEITDDVKKLLLEKRNLPEGRLKWFEISFQNRIEEPAPPYSIFNYGKKGFLKRLSEGDLYTMEEVLKKYDIEYLEDYIDK